MSGETLNKQERAQIKSLQQDKRWDAVMRFVGLKLAVWREEPISGQNAFEELRMLHKRDGKVEGVLEIFNQMEKEAFDD